ncbi:helix-turn-helix domain-containing protein [Streptomyces sp. NBC_00441]|uniref:helix-turn-helix domain-containing protein n=1 Tax=Streptomyces sp. NBC_00441 TaxID=2975742 RepID=UPI002E2BC887|nr:helix-turn-helix domain-containing protein [Streptomyces sp. NBC_00441]
MATPQDIAPSRAPSGSPAAGVQQVNVRHISGFTVIGNHLAQHAQLSLTAIGLAAHIQSLPTGARVGIKLLAARFPESEARIASALRELEAAGYLRRDRVRLPDGRVVTRTTSYNQPQESPEQQEPAPNAPPEQREPAPAAPPAPEPHPEAATLLTDLRRQAPQLTLSATAISELAPAVATWLARDVHPATVRHALTSDLPPIVRHPAGFVRNRLTALLPPPLPTTPNPAPAATPLQDCDRCDRVFRAPQPGHCRDCRTDQTAMAHTYLSAAL